MKLRLITLCIIFIVCFTKPLLSQDDSPAEMLYESAVDSLVPLQISPYFDEISFRTAQPIFDYREYSFVFRIKNHSLPFSEVVIYEAVDNSIRRQLFAIYKAQPNYSLQTAFSKIKVNRKVLSARKYPVIDSLINSVLSIQISISKNDSIVYLDPAWNEIRIRNSKMNIRFGTIDDSHPLVQWADKVRTILDSLK